MEELNGKDSYGFFVLDENGNKCYLKDNKDKYIELMKKAKLNKTLNEKMSMKAKHILWKNTEYENFH